MAILNWCIATGEKLSKFRVKTVDGKTLTLTSDLTKQSIEFAVDGKTITLSMTEDGEVFKIIYEKQ